MLQLYDYDITVEREFLTPYNMDEISLPSDFDTITCEAPNYRTEN